MTDLNFEKKTFLFFGMSENRMKNVFLCEFIGRDEVNAYKFKCIKSLNFEIFINNENVGKIENN